MMRKVRAKNHIQQLICFLLSLNHLSSTHFPLLCHSDITVLMRATKQTCAVAAVLKSKRLAFVDVCSSVLYVNYILLELDF